jgi:hypothetical protein
MRRMSSDAEVAVFADEEVGRAEHAPPAAVLPVGPDRGDAGPGVHVDAVLGGELAEHRGSARRAGPLGPACGKLRLARPL